MSVAEDGRVASRGSDLVLARIHLRLGSLALARAELETLAGRDGLDEDGLVDLAEARWRTGDITGAGEAAAAALDDENGPLLALVVAAEAAAARGRPTEARRLADKALEAAAGSIDALFAGMPRAAVWPPDAAAPPPSPTTMFDPPRRAISPVHRHPRPHDEPAATTSSTQAVIQVPDAGADADAATIGFWDAMAGSLEVGVPADLGADVELGEGTDTAGELPTGDIELDLGRAALDAGESDEAAVRLSLVLRVAPALAPAVLELVDGRTERGLVLVRGDAYRLLGRELEARRAFIEAARGGSPPLVADHGVGPSDARDPSALPDPPESSDPDPLTDPADQPSEGDPA